MNKNDIEELLKSDGPLEEIKLDVNKIRESISEYKSEKLCEMIVCDRYFGLEEQISPICMEELARRRAEGDTFEFEKYVEKVYSELPVLDFSMPDVTQLLQQAMKASKMAAWK